MQGFNLPCLAQSFIDFFPRENRYKFIFIADFKSSLGAVSFFEAFFYKGFLTFLVFKIFLSYMEVSRTLFSFLFF